MSINKSYAVFGLGRYGCAVARELVSNGAEVIAIDINEKNVENNVNFLPVCKCADITDPEVINQLGISEIDTVIIAIAGNIEASVMATMLCKDAGVKEIIVKCSSEMHKRILLSIGADKVVFPEHESGVRLAKDLLSSGFLDVANLSENISIVEINVSKKWCGHTLKELDLRKKHGLNVIALITDSKTELINNPDTVLDEQMKLVVIADKNDIEKLK